MQCIAAKYSTVQLKQKMYGMRIITSGTPSDPWVSSGRSMIDRKYGTYSILIALNPWGMIA